MIYPKAKAPTPSAIALWSLLWRAVLLTPLAMLFGTVWLLVRMGIYVLPFVEILLVWNQEWFLAAIVPMVWVLAFGLRRWKWFRHDRGDFPNEQENI